MFLTFRHRGLALQTRRLQQCATRYASSSVANHERTPVKPYYITTPIFYPNAVPHIGHLYTLVVGDVFARYRRLVEPGREIKFLVGTDEHGMKIQQAAAKAEVEVSKFCDDLSQVFKNLSAKANISYTTFARTTQERHRDAVHHVWKVLEEKGYIYKGEYEGWYSITDECFYTTQQVVKNAEGVYVSKETGSKVEWTKEYNYMFRLSAFKDALSLRYNDQKPVYPLQYNSVVCQTLSEPVLADISISRPRSRLTWGIQVPDDPEHTIYVWFDALLIYLSGAGFPKSTVGWPADLQIIGKDILRFHAIYLPAIILALSGPSFSQLAAKKPSQLLESPSPALPTRLLTHAHWTVSQAKMSKSVGNVVDPVQSMDKYGVDIVRFYLARVGGRFRDDVDWSFEQLEKHAKELQSLLGNYLLRVNSARIIKSAKRPDIIPEKTIHPLNGELLDAALALPLLVKGKMESMEIAEALEAILEVLRLANKIVTDIAPWAKETDAEVVWETRQVALATLRIAGVALKPFLPETAERLLDALGLEQQGKGWESVQEMRREDVWVERDVKGVKLF